jgi:2-dehydro-3-deoxyphosphogluconate aldolase/(4S)-4-hydroxy-2-oxoglutarate aldolase
MIPTFNSTLFQQFPVVGILRAFGRDEIDHMVPASLDGGLTNIEVTMNSPGAVDLIARCITLAGPQANVGAGTVTDLDRLHQALAAGASFIVTPTVVPEVIEACVERGVPVMPGAYSPTEIQQAWDLGAHCVKIFPAETLGPDYVRSIKAPLPHIALMPTGGVSVETLGRFKRAGASAFGVGGPLFDPKQVAAANWSWFRTQAIRFRQAYQES